MLDEERPHAVRRGTMPAAISAVHSPDAEPRVA
jgi:hypothetical protein